MKTMKTIMVLLAVVLAAWFWWHQTPMGAPSPTPTPIVQPKQMGPIVIASPTGLGLDESGPKSDLDRFNEKRSKAFERSFGSSQPDK